MKLFEKKSSIVIEEDDLQDARLSSIDFSNESIKKRVFMNVLGARLGMKMLFSQKIEANNLYSLYTIHNVIEELDIADIYFQGIKIDVRLVFNREEIFIPKTHFKYNMLPDLYLVLELNQDFEYAEFLGFFEPKTLNVQNENKDFYFYEYDRLIDPKTIKTFLKDFVVEGNFNISENNFENAEELFISLADKEVSQKDKIALFKYLADDISLREKMVEFENFEILSKEIAKNSDMLKDGILDVIGTQQIYEEEELTPFETKAEVISEVLTDLLEVNDVPSDDETFDNSANVLVADISPTGAVLGGFTGVGENDISLDLDDNFSDEESEEDFLESISIKEEPDEIIDFDNNFEPETVSLDEFEEKFDLPENQSEIETDIEANIENESVELQELQMFEELPELELDNDFSEDFILPETELNDEIPEENTVPSFNESEFEGNQDSEIFDKTESIDSQEELLDKLSELDDFADLDEGLEDNSAIAEKYFGNMETKQQETELNNNNDDDFNFKMLDEIPSEENDFYDNIISFDEISANQTGKNTVNEEISEAEENEKMQRLRELEQEETDENQEKSDEFIAQVDEFLRDADISNEQKELLNEEFNLDDLEETLVTDDKQIPTEVYLSDEVLENSESDNEFSTQEEQPENSNEDIKLLFQGENTDEMPALNSEYKKAVPLIKNKRMIIAASAASVVIVSLAIGGTVMHLKNNNVNTPQDVNKAPISAEGQAPTELLQNNNNNNQMPEQYSKNQAQPQNPDQDLNQLSQPTASSSNQQAAGNRDMGKAVTDAFLSEPVNATISKIAWEVPEDVAYNDGFRKYLQIAGKNLKLNLQNNLLLATEMAYSNKVVVDLSISNNGSLQSSSVVTSSGSKQIDKIVLQSVKETIKYLKLPSGELGSNSVDATLIINF